MIGSPITIWSVSSRRRVDAFSNHSFVFLRHKSFASLLSVVLLDNQVYHVIFSSFVSIKEPFSRPMKQQERLLRKLSASISSHIIVEYHVRCRSPVHLPYEQM